MIAPDTQAPARARSGRSPRPRPGPRRLHVLGAREAQAVPSAASTAFLVNVSKLHPHARALAFLLLAVCVPYFTGNTVCIASTVDRTGVGVMEAPSYDNR